MNDHAIAQSADKLVDQPYAMGDTKKGFDCLNSLKTFYESIGVNFPAEFEGIDEKTYPKIWFEDQDKARKILVRFLKGLGRTVDNHHYCRGDLLLFQIDKNPDSVFPGIYCGNGNVLICWGKDKGIRMFPFENIKKHLVEVRRLE